MALTPVEFPRFGGLDLRGDPQELQMAAATDLLDVDLDRNGRLRSRDGYVKWTSAPGASRYQNLYGVSGNSGAVVRLFAAAAPGVVAYYFDNTSVTSAALIGGAPFSLTTFGNAGEFVYGPSGNVANSLLRWQEGAGFIYPAVGYHGIYVAKQPIDNRLVLASSSDNSHRSRVRFSDAGAPETFGANNYVDLAPFDGSYINGIEVHGNNLFVFKADKFAVFYGNSVSGTGTPVFDYRWVDTGIGIPFAYSGCCCSSPEGVYFVGADGIYLTSGGPPQKISGALDPLFGVTSLPPYYSGSVIAQSSTFISASLTWHQGRVHFATSTAGTANDRVFVYDPETGWLVWSVPAAGLTKWLPSPNAANYQRGQQKYLYFSYATGTNDIGVITPGATTDAGAAIASKYRTGFWNPGKPGAEADIFEWELDGSGSVTVKTAVNDAATLGTGAAVTLGTSPAIAQGRDMRAVWGRNVSLELSGTAPWSVSRVIANVRGQTWPGYKAA